MEKYRKFSEWQKDVAGIPPIAPKASKAVDRHDASSLGALGVLDEELSKKISFQDAVDEYEERAAIMEFDGGMDRDAAETAALEDCKLIWREKVQTRRQENQGVDQDERQFSRGGINGEL